MLYTLLAVLLLVIIGGFLLKTIDDWVGESFPGCAGKVVVLLLYGTIVYVIIKMVEYVR